MEKTYKDIMLDLVLSDKKLHEKYNYDLSDIEGLNDALLSDSPIVRAVATIINGIHSSRFDDTVKRDLYTKVFTYLNKSLLS